MKVANKVAQQAEKDNDAAQKEVQELQRVMEPKRARTHAATADDDEECEKQSCDDWDLPDHRREVTRIQNRRSIPLGSRGEVPTPEEGKARPLEHSRLGLSGWMVKLTVWKEDQFTVLPGQGIKNRETRVTEWVVKTLSLAKSGVWGCVQTRTQWSTEEDAHMRPGHHWLCEFGDAGNGTSFERQFNLGHHQCEDYRGTRFYNKDSALVIKFWLNRVEEDASGLTFQEWTPDVDTSRPPVAMMIEERDCEVLMVWVLKGLFCQWMMTLNSGHDVSE